MPITRNRLRSSTSSTQVVPDSVRNEPSNRNQQQAPLAITTTAAAATTNSSSRTSATNVSNPVDQPAHRKNFNVLIAVTGSVAAVKLIELIKKLTAQFPQAFVNKADNRTYEATISIRVLMTENSKHFVNKADIINSLDGTTIEVFDDADEWAQWKKMGDPVLHIELRKWADLCVIAPLDANTMAKIATGICDNLLTCVVRAWDCKKSLFYCPAMNVHMYDHPITKDQLCKLQSFGYLRIDSVEKRLACGDVGMGAMASVDTIVNRILDDLVRPVPKLPSPIKSSLLNQQPTYPIMSTSEPTAASKNLGAVSLQNKYTSSSWTNFNARGVGKGTITRNGPSLGQSLLVGAPKIDNLLAKSRNLPLLNNINGNSNGVKNLSTTRQSSRPSLVKSLKNLKAINPDLLNLSVNDDILDDEDDLGDANNDDEFFTDTGLDLTTGAADLSYSIDPSRLLEQSLITEDDHGFGNMPRQGPQQQLSSNNSSTSNVSNWAGSIQRNEASYSPIFNTSKFLSQCYVKERGCFNCAICKNDYKNRKSMSRHLREQHVQGNIYKCIPCDVGFKRREKLIKHNRDKHPE